MSNAMQRAIDAILDLAVAVDETASDDVNSRAIITAFEVLQTSGAIRTHVDPKTGRAGLNVTPLLMAVGATIGALAELHASHTGEDRLTVISDLRQLLREDFAD
jgi:hypothetical protein